MVRVAYDQIYRNLKEEIEDGTYAYQDLLPSQSQLVKRYQCAHNTVRKAISKLTAEGYCLPIHGKGVRVIWRPDNEPIYFSLGGLEAFEKSARKGGLEVRTAVTLFEYVFCDARHATITGFAEDTPLLHLERVRYLNDRPLVRDKSYLRASMVEGITREDAERSVYAYVEDERGLRIATSKRTISMQLASEADRQLLDIDDCRYLAKVAHATYDSDGILFEYAESRCHPAYFCFRDTLVRDRMGSWDETVSNERAL